MAQEDPNTLAKKLVTRLTGHLQVIRDYRGGGDFIPDNTPSPGRGVEKDRGK